MASRRRRRYSYPSGTLANHLALRALARDRRRVIVPEMSHIYNDTGDGCQTLSALTLVPLAPGAATFTVEDVAASVRASTARMFIASAYTGVAPRDYAAPFDTVYVSLWKSFDAGQGAILAG